MTQKNQKDFCIISATILRLKCRFRNSEILMTNGRDDNLGAQDILSPTFYSIKPRQQMKNGKSFWWGTWDATLPTAFVKSQYFLKAKSCVRHTDRVPGNYEFCIVTDLVLNGNHLSYVSIFTGSCKSGSIWEEANQREGNCSEGSTYKKGSKGQRVFRLWLRFWRPFWVRGQWYQVKILTNNLKNCFPFLW